MRWRPWYVRFLAGAAPSFGGRRFAMKVWTWRHCSPLMYFLSNWSWRIRNPRKAIELHWGLHRLRQARQKGQALLYVESGHLLQ